MQPQRPSDTEAWVRPYVVTDGRAAASRELNDLTWIMTAAGVDPEALAIEHARVWGLCRGWTTVAEVAARLRQPIPVAKILVADLLDLGIVEVEQSTVTHYVRDHATLERLLYALQTS